MLVFLFMFYLTTPSVGQTIQRSMVEWSVNNKLESIWKGALMSQFQVGFLAWDLPEGDWSKSQETRAGLPVSSSKIWTLDIPNATQKELLRFIYKTTEHISTKLCISKAWREDSVEFECRILSVKHNYDSLSPNRSSTASWWMTCHTLNSTSINTDLIQVYGFIWNMFRYAEHQTKYNKSANAALREAVHRHFTTAFCTF
jgi:hypothetical protein